MEIVYLRFDNTRKGEKDGYFIKHKYGYLPIIILTETHIESFGDDAKEFIVDISKRGELIHEGIKRIEILE